MIEWFVPGEPAVWLGSGEKDWKRAVAQLVVPGALPPAAFLQLDFRVASFLRAGQPFDLDNMVTPVFDALLGPRHSAHRRALVGWSATRVEDRPPGLCLRCGDQVPAPSRIAGARIALQATLRGGLPLDSREGGAAFVSGIREALDSWAPAHGHRFALELAFGDDVRDISWVAEAPVKPVVDCLFPVFGGAPGAPDDWKVHALRIERGRPDLRGACSVGLWVLPGDATSRGTGVPGPKKAIPPAAGPVPATTTRRSGMTNFDCLDEAAKALGSPPAELRIAEILTRAAALFPEMARVSKDSASASMDYQTINVRGRTTRPGDFNASDRWNRSPAFLKTERGVWRRLSDTERSTFARLWSAGEPLLRRESYDAAEWDVVVRRAG